MADNFRFGKIRNEESCVVCTVVYADQAQGDVIHVVFSDRTIGRRRRDALVRALTCDVNRAHLRRGYPTGGTVEVTLYVDATFDPGWYVVETDDGRTYSILEHNGRFHVQPPSRARGRGAHV